MRLIALIKPFRTWAVIAVLLSALTIGSSIALMSTSAYLISRAALVSDEARLTIAIASVRLFAILRAGGRYLERLTSHKATLDILVRLRVWFYAAIEPLAPARLMHYRSGDLLARSVADVETLESFYIRVLLPPTAAALAIAFACGILGLFDPLLALALLVYLLAAGVVLPLSMHRLGRRTSAALVITRAELNSMLVDEIQGSADLLVFDGERQHHGRVLTLSRQLNRLQQRMATLRGASTALTGLLAFLATLTVLWLAIPSVTSGKIDGVYLAVLPLTAIASFEAVQPLASALQQMEGQRAAGRRLFELIDQQPDVTEPDHITPPPRDLSIELRNVHFGYDPAGPLALDDVSFRLPMHSYTAITGPSGSGKSTIVNLLLRFWEYGSGTITLGDRDLRDYRTDDVHALFGVVPQDIHLFNTTVRDNLLLANPDATDDQIVAACRQALLHDFVESLPRGYDTIIGEHGLLLSGGERQRLAIARAILKNAPILILDEPTANLDVRTERELMRSLEPFMGNRTVLIISHRPIALEYADQVIGLEKGRIVTAR
jgi:ATP-binding cassette subfamily C protein CydC